MTFGQDQVCPSPGPTRTPSHDVVHLPGTSPGRGPRREPGANPSQTNRRKYYPSPRIVTQVRPPPPSEGPPPLPLSSYGQPNRGVGYIDRAQPFFLPSPQKVYKM